MKKITLSIFTFIFWNTIYAQYQEKFLKLNRVFQIDSTVHIPYVPTPAWGAKRDTVIIFTLETPPNFYWRIDNLYLMPMSEYAKSTNNANAGYLIDDLFEVGNGAIEMQPVSTGAFSNDAEIYFVGRRKLEKTLFLPPKTKLKWKVFVSYYNRLLESPNGTDFKIYLSGQEFFLE